MKMLLDAELETISMTEFTRGFEACRAMAIQACRTSQADPYNLAKTAADCANKILLLPVPRWRAKEEKQSA